MYRLPQTAEAVRAFDKAGDSEKKATLFAIRDALEHETGVRILSGDTTEVTPDAHNGYLRRLLRNDGQEGCVLTSEERARRRWGW